MTPLLIYFIIAFALCWGSILLGRIERLHFWAPMLCAFAPAIAALLVSGLSEGEAAVRSLLRRLGDWRVAPSWYAVVFGLPLAEAVLAVSVATLLGKTAAVGIGPLEQLYAMMPAIWWFSLLRLLRK